MDSSEDQTDVKITNEDLVKALELQNKKFVEFESELTTFYGKILNLYEEFGKLKQDSVKDLVNQISSEPTA